MRFSIEKDIGKKDNNQYKTESAKFKTNKISKILAPDEKNQPRNAII